MSKFAASPHLPTLCAEIEAEHGLAGGPFAGILAQVLAGLKAAAGKIPWSKMLQLLPQIVALIQSGKGVSDILAILIPLLTA